MKMQELLNEYPKTATVIKQWLLEKMLKGLKDDKLPENFKDMVRKDGITDDKVVGILEGNPRSLFDIFDEHILFISVIAHNQGFIWYINDGESSDVYTARKAADEAAVVEAFKLLEAKL